MSSSALSVLRTFKYQTMKNNKNVRSLQIGRGLVLLPVVAVLIALPSISIAEEWKFGQKLDPRLIGVDSDAGISLPSGEIGEYRSDGEPINWRSRDEDIEPHINDWSEIDSYQRVKPVLDGAKESQDLIGNGRNPYATYDDLSNMPEQVDPWWDKEARATLGAATTPYRVSPESLMLRAMTHSSQIKVFSDVPVIRETSELEALAGFDPVAYFDYRLTDLDEPVGSTLKTGSADRFLEDEWLFKSGIRKKFITGTELDISQRWGVLDNNSDYLVPKDQANSRLAITLTQPLLNGAGVRYNRSLIDVARLDGSIARDEFKRQIESHLLELTRSYWGLYLERTVLIQRRALVDRTQKIVDTLEARENLDVSSVQLQRLRSEVLDRKSNVVRAESAVRNAEARIVSLINDPEFHVSDSFELIPEMEPVTRKSTISHDVAVALALSNRPEISQSLKQLRASAIRESMTKSELRPVLNFVLGYYRDGLAAQGDNGESFSNQFDTGDGSWTAGLVFEVPLGNRAAKARHQRRQAEGRQLANQLKTTIDTVMVEVQVSVREIETAYREMQSKYSAMEAVRSEVGSLEDRQSVELSGGGNGSAYLERLLEAQDRLVESEFEFTQSATTYNIALANIDRATGVLMQTNDIQPRYYEDSDSYIDDLPGYKLERVNLVQ